VRLARGFPELIRLSIHKLSNGKSANQAADLVKENSLSFKDFPSLISVLRQKSVYWTVNAHTKDEAELKLRNDRFMLAEAAKIYNKRSKCLSNLVLIYKGSNKLDDPQFAFSLIAKYDLLEELKSVDQFLAFEYTQRVEAGENIPRLKNKIEQQDWFGPLSDAENALSLKEFGFSFKDVKIIKTVNEFLEVLPSLLSEKLVSLVTFEALIRRSDWIQS